MKAYREVKLVFTGEMVDVGEPINDHSLAAARIREYIGKSPKEILVSLMLDVRKCAIDIETISIGTLVGSLMHPREIFRTAIHRGAAGLILAHNHPSGNHAASREDIAVTRRIVKAGNVVGIPVIDHIILGAKLFTSLKKTNPEIFEAIDNE